MKHSSVLHRQEMIVHLLDNAGWLPVDALARELGVSEWTVRRDLIRLVDDGLVQRKHGAVALVVPSPVPRLDTFESRRLENQAAKEAIGRMAAQRLRPYDAIALGAGTTTTLVARELARTHQKPMHVMTNALNIAMDLAFCPSLQVTCAGGDVRSDHFTLTGPVAERALRNHYYDVAVIGVSGITIDEGLTVDNQLDARTLEIMIEQSRRLVVVADASKVGRVHFVRLMPLAKVDMLVMDTSVSPQFRDMVSQLDVEFVGVDPA